MKWLLLFACPPLLAHVVSMSTGELHIDGARARYDLRIPAYEIVHVRSPERAFFENIHFRSTGSEARLLNSECSNRADMYVCRGDYSFPTPPDSLTVQCTFPSVTVPNHVHLLRVYNGNKSDQAVFDLSFTDAQIRFRPLGAMEMALKQFGLGLLRAIEATTPLLFLLALVLASRSRRETGLLAAGFVGGEAVALAAASIFHLFLPSRFVEAAAALTIAYLALEIVLLPHSQKRWVIVIVLGLFHGLYFSTPASGTAYSPAIFFSGVALAQTAAIAILWLILRNVLATSRVVAVAAALLLCTGIGWFILRLWG